MSKRKKTGRSKQKFAALMPKYNSRIRNEYLDQDYLHTLSVEELQWLNNFMEEFNNANLDHEGKKLTKSKKERKKIYDQNNARNRCVYGIAKATGTLGLLDTKALDENIDNSRPTENITENALIDYLEAKIDAEKLEETSNNSKKKSKNTKKL